MMLEVENLKVNYGSIEALHGISLSVDRGEIVSLIGANGAGKTSTLLSLSRLPKPDAPGVSAGDIKIDGVSILNTPPHELVKNKQMVLVPEGRHIFGNLSVHENLELSTFARDSKKEAKQIEESFKLVYKLFPRLDERRKQRSEQLSGGEQQMLAVGRALMTGAGFIMLDEPSMGLAPVLVQELFRALRAMSESGLTILLVEQNAKIALEFSNRGYVIDTGEIITCGPSGELLNNEEVKKAYLGA